MLTMLALGGGALIGYGVRSATAPATHMSALPWEALEQGWRAAKKGDEFLYGDTLKTLQNMAGQNVALFGYMLPIEAGETHRHFLFGSRNHTCPFCMPANAGNLVEVYTEEALPYRAEAFLLQGIFHMEEQEHSDLIYSLTQAQTMEEQ